MEIWFCIGHGRRTAEFTAGDYTGATSMRGFRN
jgi:hypothetical protein